MKINFFRDC